MDEMVLCYVRSQYEVPRNDQRRADSLMSVSEISQSASISANYQIALVRRFDFSSKLQRMSVITKNFLDNSFRTFVKGSPERIRELCNPSTVPTNFDEVLQIYT
jgi:magnesium-transporting ATPase (P-type)